MTQVGYRHTRILRALTYAERHGTWANGAPPTISDDDLLDLLRAGWLERRSMLVATPYHAPAAYPYRPTPVGRSW